jgi:hypothetical protein
MVHKAPEFDLNIATREPYPGDMATAAEIAALADSYWRAARHLNDQVATKGKPLTRMPVYLCGIQSIELYLVAFLRHSGRSNGEVRGFHHDFAASLDLACTVGLKIDARTAKHLASMTDCREYVVSRYAPEAARKLSPITRLFRSIENISLATHVALSA